MIPTLNGLRILNTRPLAQGQKLTHAIQRAGGISIPLPMLHIESTPTDWLEQLPPVEQIDQCIFTSTNAVHHFFSGLAQKNLILSTTTLFTAIGSTSAQALNTYGIEKVNIPSCADSEHLLELAHLQNVKGQTILLIKGEKGRGLIPEKLIQREANLIELDVYRRLLPKTCQTDCKTLWQNNAVDIILLTSEESLQNLFVLFGPEAKSWLCHKPCIVISDRLKQAATSLGMQSVLVCAYVDILNTLQGLVDEQHQ